MLGRAGFGVAEAEKARRATKPLQDDRVLGLIAEARRKLGIGRALSAMVTETLDSPAVVGVLLPTLILPLGLLTSMPPDQLRFILLHELAHVRRGDYLANLVQLFIEALLFFNPAVWWLSRQVRFEREACCDALAIAVAEDRSGYARALARVAEQNLKPLPGTATAFADRRRPAGLKDRIQRLLVPGYRPTMPVTWKAMAGSVILGCGLLIISAVGAQWTVAAASRLLTPQQRIARIERRMKELGQAPIGDKASSELIEVNGRIQTSDGSPLPRNTSAGFHAFSRNSSISQWVAPKNDGECRSKIQRGDLYFCSSAEGFAPACAGPIDTRETNSIERIELTLERGFPVSLTVTDADSGKPVEGASLKCQFWIPRRGSSFGDISKLATDDRGIASLEHCGSVPLVVTMAKPGYEITERRLDHPTPGDTLTLSTRRALPIAGLVMDRASGATVENAAIYLIGVHNAPGVYGSDPGHGGSPLALSNGQGRFDINELPRGGSYWFLIRGAGHADTVLSEISAGTTNLNAALGPELAVRGEFRGDLSSLFKGDSEPAISFEYSYSNGRDSQRLNSGSVPVRIEADIGHFEFVTPIAGPVRIRAGARVFSRTILEPVEDWHIDVRTEANGTSPDGSGGTKSRKVVIQFEAPTGVPPKGTISVNLPGSDPYTAARKEMEIENGQVVFEAPVGQFFSFEPARTVGYWFAGKTRVDIADEAGPRVVKVPVIPAGAIYAQARREDGALAGNVGFSVRELKRSPSVTEAAFTTPAADSWSSHGGPRRYVASPLPLGGTYVVIASQDNHFAVSKPIKLTEEAPDQSVELQFTNGAPILGQVLSPDSKPLLGASVTGEWRYRDSSFGLASRLTDEQGRFSFEDCTRAIGEYSVTVRHPGLQTLSQPVMSNEIVRVLKLRPGLRLGGRVIEASSRRPVVSAEVRAIASSGGLPTETARTDDQGNFEFDTLNQASYRLFVNGCYYANGTMSVKPGTVAPLVLEVKIARGASVQLGTDDSASAAPSVQRSDAVIGPGLIDFRNAELSQVLQVYSELAGAQVDTSQIKNLPPLLILFRNKQALTRSEAVRLLEQALLDQAGIKASYPDGKHVRLFRSP